MPRRASPPWLWPAAALVGLAVGGLAIGYEPHLLAAELLAAGVTIVVGLLARWWLRRRAARPPAST